MKKKLLVLLLVLQFGMVQANPLIPPRVLISELAFDETGSWMLELQGFDFTNWFYLDSIILTTSTGKATLGTLRFEGENNILVLRKDSLKSDLPIRMEGDSISLLFYPDIYYMNGNIPSLVFGDFTSSVLASPRAGQSIAGAPSFEYTNNYSIDKSPTPGLQNDTTGMCGTLTGKIFDINNQLVQSSDYVFMDRTGWEYNIDGNGNYRTRILSARTTLSSMNVYHKPTRKYLQVPVETIAFSVQPDTLIQADLHLQKDLITALDEPENAPVTMLQVYPTPPVGRQLNYSVGLPVGSSEARLELIDLNGRIYCTYRITESQGRIELPSELSSGTFFLRLQLNRRTYPSVKITLQ